MSPCAWNHQGGITKLTSDLSSNRQNLLDFCQMLLKWLLDFKDNTAASKPTLPDSSHNAVTKHHVLAWSTCEVFATRILLGTSSNLQGVIEWPRKIDAVIPTSWLTAKHATLCHPVFDQINVVPGRTWCICVCFPENRSRELAKKNNVTHLHDHLGSISNWFSLMQKKQTCKNLETLRIYCQATCLDNDLTFCRRTPMSLSLSSIAPCILEAWGLKGTLICQTMFWRSNKYIIAVGPSPLRQLHQMRPAHSQILVNPPKCVQSNSKIKNIQVTMSRLNFKFFLQFYYFLVLASHWSLCGNAGSKQPRPSGEAIKATPPVSLRTSLRPACDPRVYRRNFLWPLKICLESSFVQIAFKHLLEDSKNARTRPPFPRYEQQAYKLHILDTLFEMDTLLLPILSYCCSKPSPLYMRHRVKVNHQWRNILHKPRKRDWSVCIVFSRITCKSSISLDRSL